MTNLAKKLSIIIPARNEAATLHDVLVSCLNLQPHEVIVVANGCTDRTPEIAKIYGCKVILEKEPLGNDVGRAIGASVATGDVLLFLDADFALPPDRLRTFLQPIMTGQADAVLNDMDMLFQERKSPHSTTVWRQVFNAMLGRGDLRIDSLLSVPHAFTWEVLKQIGAGSLANPILAHAKLITLGFRIHHGFGFDVIKLNRYRPGEHAVSREWLSPSEKRIIGDHLEALSYAFREPRAGFADGGRRREIVEKLKSGQLGLPIISDGWKTLSTSLYGGKRLSVVIPAQDEEKTLAGVIKEVRKLEPFEIIVVVNGSSDATAKIAVAEGAKTILFSVALGNDTGRAVGALAAKGDIILFIDADFVLSANELYPYAKAAQQGVDVALNNLNHYLYLRYPLNLVTACKYALNLALDRKSLGIGSLIAVPHAMTRNALNKIGCAHLTSPGVAQVRAVLSDCRLANVHQTEVDRINRIRPEQHFSLTGTPPAVSRIVGDHVEALYYLLKTKGSRGWFEDRVRKWDRVKGIR